MKRSLGGSALAAAPSSPGCTPEEIARMAQLAASNTIGSLEITPISVEENVDNVSGTGAEAYRKWTMAPFGSLRTARAAFGPEFAATAHNEIQMSVNKTYNELSDGVRKLNDIFKPLLDDSSFTKRWVGRFISFPQEPDGQLLTELMKTTKGGAPAEGASVYESVAQKTRDLVESKYAKLVRGTDLQGSIPTPKEFFEEYLPLMAQKPQGRGVFWANPEKTEAEKDFIFGLTKDKINWFTNHEIHGGLTNIENRGSIAVNTYLNNITRAAYIKTTVDDIENRIINPMFNVKFLNLGGDARGVMSNDVKGYNMWREYKDYLLGGATAGDARLAYMMNSVLNKFGYNASTQSLYYVTNMLNSLVYASTMGLRPASIVRQFGQLIPSYAVFGARDMAAGLKRALEDIPTGQDLARFESNGYLASHVDSIIQQMDAAKQAGKAVSAMTEPLMKMFGYADRLVRVSTAHSSEIAFDRAAASGDWSHLPIAGGPEIRQEVTKMANMGRLEEAKRLYTMHMISEIQYSYGKANRPEVLRGALGNLMGMFLSYPLNTFEMLHGFARQAFTNAATGKFDPAIWHNDPAPLLRLMGASLAATWVGSQYLNADLRSAMFFTAMPHSLFFPQFLADGWNAGTSTVNWGTGNLFVGGTTDYDKKLMLDHYNNFARDAMNFVPLYGVYNDITKMYNEGSVARAFALTPKPEILNQEAAAKRAERRAASGGGGGDYGNYGNFGAFNSGRF
jgi:hypothetical protein